MHEKTYTDFGENGFRQVSTVNDSWHRCGNNYYGNVENSHRGEPGQPQLRTHTTYACRDIPSAYDDATSYIVDRPAYVKVTGDNANDVLEERWMHYDQNFGVTHGNVIKGNLSRVEAWIDQGDLGLGGNCLQRTSSKCAVTSMAYDSLRGLLIQVTDPNGFQTHTSYDTSNWLYPATITRAINVSSLAHKTTTTFDPKCAKLAEQTIDYTGGTEPPLTQRLRNTYDPYCRLQTVYRPGEDEAVVTVPYRKYHYLLGASGVPTATVVESREPNRVPDGFVRSSVLADGLGRVIQRKEDSVIDGAAKVVATTTAYDSAGNTWEQYVPVALDASTAFETYTPPVGIPGKSTMLYDAAGRLGERRHRDRPGRRAVAAMSGAAHVSAAPTARRPPRWAASRVSAPHRHGYRIIRAALRPLLRVYFGVEGSGLEHIPRRGPYILATNHVSMLDWAFVCYFLPEPVRFVVDREYFDLALLRPAMRINGALPAWTDRPDPAALRAARAVLAVGEPLILTPEGRISRTGRPGKARPGIIALAAALQVPILPAAIQGAFEAFPRHRRLPRPGKVTVRFAPLLPPPRAVDRATQHLLVGRLMDHIGDLLAGTSHVAPPW